MLGQLFLNRMQGIAYDVLRQKGLLGKVTREFRNSLLYAFLERGGVVTKKDIRIPSLSKEDFFLHLCAHLYKEATTLPWIEIQHSRILFFNGDKRCPVYLVYCVCSCKNNIFQKRKETTEWHVEKHTT